MFNKSIVVALILCACYLGALQASVLTTAGKATDTVDQVGHIVPNAQGIPQALVSNLPVHTPLSDGNLNLPVVGH